MQELELSVETTPAPRDVEVLASGLTAHAIPVTGRAGFLPLAVFARDAEGSESAAIERGCKGAHLDTFSYQARPFYERHGYTLFATLDDYPPGHQRFFLRKSLGVDATRRD